MYEQLVAPTSGGRWDWWSYWHCCWGVPDITYATYSSFPSGYFRPSPRSGMPHSRRQSDFQWFMVDHFLPVLCVQHAPATHCHSSPFLHGAPGREGLSRSAGQVRHSVLLGFANSVGSKIARLVFGLNSQVSAAPRCHTTDKSLGIETQAAGPYWRCLFHANGTLLDLGLAAPQGGSLDLETGTATRHSKGRPEPVKILAQSRHNSTARRPLHQMTPVYGGI